MESIPAWFELESSGPKICGPHKVAFAVDKHEFSYDFGVARQIPASSLLCKTTFENANMSKNPAHFGTAHVVMISIVYSAIQRHRGSRVSR